jgi:hypothetical protein
MVNNKMETEGYSGLKRILMSYLPFRCCESQNDGLPYHDRQPKLPGAARLDPARFPLVALPGTGLT